MPGELKSALLVELLRRGEIRSVIAFTRTKHRANRLADYLLAPGVATGRIHGNRSQAQRTQALGAFKDGRFPVLVATDIAARGIDVDALCRTSSTSTCPPRPRTTSIAWAGRRAPKPRATPSCSCLPRRKATCAGSSAPSASRFPRVILPGFDYTKKPAEKLEVPLAQRLAEMRAQRAPATPTAGRALATLSTFGAAATRRATSRAIGQKRADVLT